MNQEKTDSIRRSTELLRVLRLEQAVAFGYLERPLVALAQPSGC